MLGGWTPGAAPPSCSNPLLFPSTRGNRCHGECALRPESERLHGSRTCAQRLPQKREGDDLIGRARCAFEFADCGQELIVP
jgi:hypothetical protein